MVKTYKNDEVSCDFCAVFQVSQSNQAQEAGNSSADNHCKGSAVLGKLASDGLSNLYLSLSE